LLEYQIFAALFIIFKVPTKLFSDLYPAKSFFPCKNICKEDSLKTESIILYVSIKDY